MSIKKLINKSRVAIVTGGSKNIGLSICAALLKNNIKVAAVGSNQDSIMNAFKDPRILNSNESDIKGYVCDLSKTKDIYHLVDRVISDFGKIDIIINSAGVLDLSSIEETSIDIWNNAIATNLSAPFFLVQNALEQLKKSHAPRVINISSNAGRMGGYANGMSYTASKGGLISLTYGLARQLAEWNITVNCVAPGTIESDMLDARSASTKSNLLKRFPLKRFGDCDEVAEAVMYFVSESSGFTTGAVLDVNGGLFTG